MSYDLAVWVGEMPASDAAALAEFTARMEAMEAALDGGAEDEPHPRLVAFADALLARYHDLDDSSDDDTPWADGPLKNNISGDLFYFAMAPNAVVGAMPFITDTVAAHGLVCFDPQSATLRDVARENP